VVFAAISLVLGYTPHPPFFLKVLLGAGSGKNCPQNTSSKSVRGKVRETQELGAVFTWPSLGYVYRHRFDNDEGIFG
jgi:hypothetical protein